MGAELTKREEGLQRGMGGYDENCEVIMKSEG